jgi:hypothetical protein
MYVCKYCNRGDSIAESKKALCLNLVPLPRLPAVYCRPSSSPGTEAALNALRGFKELFEAPSAAIGHQISAARGVEKLAVHDDMLDCLYSLTALT